MKAEVAEIYAGIIRFEGLNTLDALKTNNRDSFVGAINELVSGKVGANDIVNGKDASYRVTDLLKWVAGGLEKSNSVNYNTKIVKNRQLPFENHKKESKAKNAIKKIIGDSRKFLYC